MKLVEATDQICIKYSYCAIKMFVFLEPVTVDIKRKHSVCFVIVIIIQNNVIFYQNNKLPD